MNEIQEEEILTAIKQSSQKKSPGPDGLPKEFYQQTWQIIKNEMTQIMNEMLRGNFDRRLTDGVIVLVKKKNRNNTINSYRPISLLNFDYKILTKILKTRMDDILPTIISNNQTACNKQNNITTALCKIRDKIAQFKYERKKGALISFDFDHAFDRVNHSFLLQLLTRLNFNAEFVTLIRKIFKNSFSKILINGKLTDDIHIKTSVRQGDPLSMVFFTIYINILLQKIEEIYNDTVDCLVAYADDITLITDSHEKITRVRQIFTSFERASGAKLNLQKTIALKIGEFQPPNWLITEEKVKILGLTFEENLKTTAENNWSKIFNSIRQLLWLHTPRNLNLLQKITLCNTFILSKAWYIAAILPITNKWTAKITSQIGMFLWRGRPIRVGFQQLTLPKIKGGLGLNAPGEKAKALFLSSFLKNSKNNIFIAQFFHIQNPPHPNTMPKIPFLKYALTELCYVPMETTQNLDPPKPKFLYSLFFSRFSTVEPLPQKNWKKIWKNIQNKQLPSKSRDFWYVLVNNKLPLRTTLYRQERVASPTCQECNQQPETLEHKFAKCIYCRELWTFIQQKIYSISSKRYKFEDLAFPENLVGIRRIKTKTLKFFAIYLNFIEKTRTEEKNITLLKLNLNCEIF